MQGSSAGDGHPAIRTRVQIRELWQVDGLVAPSSVRVLGLIVRLPTIPNVRSDLLEEALNVLKLREAETTNCDHITKVIAALVIVLGQAISNHLLGIAPSSNHAVFDAFAKRLDVEKQTSFSRNRPALSKPSHKDCERL